MPKNKMPKRPKGRKTPAQRRRQGRIITVIIGVLAILSMIALVMLRIIQRRSPWSCCRG